MTASLGLIRPEALPLLAVVAILAALAVWSEVRRRRALVAFAGRGAGLASVSEARRRLKLTLTLVALVASVAALAGPYVDVVERSVVQSGVDLVVALDVSQSMAVRDVEPDRLRAAKRSIELLGDTLTQSRVALVLFAGEGIVRYPATADPKVLGRSLDAVSGAFRPQGGSSLHAAVEAALQAFPAEARESPRRKAVVLVSDGEDLTGRVPDVAVLRERNVRLFTVGVGTPSGGPIPTYDRFGRFSGMLRAADGRQIVSRLDEGALRELAERTEGRFWRLTPGLATVNEVATELKRLDASRLGELPGGFVPDDRYQLLLVIAVTLLIVDELVSERRRMPGPRALRGRTGRFRPRIALPAFGRASSLWALLASAAILASACSVVTTSDAERLYLAGQYEAALERYRALVDERPDVLELRVNVGNALHQLGELPAALEAYDVVIKGAEPPVRAVAHYQRGGTLFRLGKLEEAREAYKGALRIDPNDRDAKFNIEVIDELLRETILQEERGQPGPQGDQGGQQPQQGQPGQPGPGQSPQPGGQEGPGEPGAEGPQREGPPTTSGDQSGPSLSDVLSDFRSNLTEEEALRLLDALIAEQRGIEVLIEGQERPQRQDPTY